MWFNTSVCLTSSLPHPHISLNLNPEYKPNSHLSRPLAEAQRNEPEEIKKLIAGGMDTSTPHYLPYYSNGVHFISL
jgi:hypothetical protein